MMRDNPKISIVIPVYNVEKYLVKCLESIISQSFADFELLLIDDGSTDGSGAICDEYGSKDARIRVWHKPNGGVSSVRNMGLENMKGEWVTFVDGDDWVDKGYLAHFSTDYDLCVQSYYYGEEQIQSPDKEVLSNPGADYLINEYVYGPYCKLYKRQIIEKNKIRFDVELSYGEDVLFWLQYLCYCKTMSVVSYAGYHYVLYESNTLRNAPKNYTKIRLMFEKHIEYFEILLANSKHRKQIMRKELFNMFHDLIMDFGINYKILKADAFLYRCYRKYLCQSDKLIIYCCPTLILFYKRFLVKYNLL